MNELSHATLNVCLPFLSSIRFKPTDHSARYGFHENFRNGVGEVHWFLPTPRVFRSDCNGDPLDQNANHNVMTALGVVKGR